MRFLRFSLKIVENPVNMKYLVVSSVTFQIRLFPKLGWKSNVISKQTSKDPGETGTQMRPAQATRQLDANSVFTLLLHCLWRLWKLMFNNYFLFYLWFLSLFLLQTAQVRTTNEAAQKLLWTCIVFISLWPLFLGVQGRGGGQNRPESQFLSNSK